MDLKRLNELLIYSPHTGEIRMKSSDKVILPDQDGFYTVWDNTSRKRTKFKADRLAWSLGNNKKLNKNQKILHLNLKPSDNRLFNLKVVSSSALNKVQEAAKNLGGVLRITPHPLDRYDFIVHHLKDKVQRKEVISDIINAQQRLLALQLHYAKILTKYCRFD